MTTLSAKDYQETKTCSACGETKPLSEFYKDKKSSDGHKSQCKHCVSLDNAARARKARAEKRAQKEATGPKKEASNVVVREKMTAQQMVDALRAEGWIVTCTRTITQEL